jgi:putative transposase
MNTREIAAEYRLSHWAGIMRERNASGMSVKAFCRTAGFHENVYFYWQRKLRESACQELLPTVNEKAMIPSGWAVCEQANAESKENSIHVEIGKCRLAVGSEFDPQVLERVCRVLMTLC